MPSRVHYWSCSTLADWIRGKPKLVVGTSDEWNDWKNAARKERPIRFWIAEEMLDKIQNFVYWPMDRLNDIRYYINNRWVSRSHACTAHARDIKPGTWCDVGNRFLPCLFNELVDFVEVETAWHHVWCDDEARKKYQTPWWRSGWLRWRTWRCAEAGLAHLDWASTLTNEEWLDDDQKHLAEPTRQALAAIEIKELYFWWTNVYRNRTDPHEASGWSEYCEAMRVKYNVNFFGSLNSKDEDDRAWSDRTHKKLREIEEAYAAEEEAMMIRLIKIRDSLWT